jgi:hypothetical protein
VAGTAPASSTNTSVILIVMVGKDWENVMSAILEN